MNISESDFRQEPFSQSETAMETGLRVLMGIKQSQIEYARAREVGDETGMMNANQLRASLALELLNAGIAKSNSFKFLRTRITPAKEPEEPSRLVLILRARELGKQRITLDGNEVLLKAARVFEASRPTKAYKIVAPSFSN